MEIRGLVLLRVADAQFGKIRLSLENNDDKGFQMQVSFRLKVVYALIKQSVSDVALLTVCKNAQVAHTRKIGQDAQL